MKGAGALPAIRPRQQDVESPVKRVFGNGAMVEGGQSMASG